MKCPRCGRESSLLVTHTYSEPGGTIRRLVCVQCEVVVVTQDIVIKVDPQRGEGAFATASRFRRAAEGVAAPAGPTAKG